MLFQTERLWVRRLDHNDLDALHEVYGCADAMRWVGDGEPLTREQCARWVAVTLGNYKKYGYGMSAVTRRDTGELAGFCGLVHPGGQREAEIKYAFRSACWGQGFATEAVRGMLAWGAGTHGLSEIIATVAPGNLASQRVLQKVGMTRAPDRRDADGARTFVFTWRADAP